MAKAATRASDDTGSPPPPTHNRERPPEPQRHQASREELLDPRRADPDLADEMVRSELGLVRPDEVIINIDD